MGFAFSRYQQVFGEDAKTFGAAGWQTNRHAAWFQEGRFDYASDTRGACPFLPLWDGVRIGCAQLPTTLPTFDELIGRDGIDERNVADVLLEKTADRRSVHVFTAHAELEGGHFLRAFEWLLAGWVAQGYEVVSLGTLYRSIGQSNLPRHEVVYGEVPGRSGKLALQSLSGVSA